MEPRRPSMILCMTLWYALLQFQTMSAVGTGTMTNTYSGLNSPKIPLSPKEIRRLKAKGVEVLPSGPAGMSTNMISQEPSCAELRSMWRYYKRQSRAAELTNEIPPVQLPEFFWNLPGPAEPSSFGPFRGRSRPRFRPKGPPRDALYGHVLLQQPNKAPRRRPVEEVVRMFGTSSRPKNPLQAPKPEEPILHLTPPVEPTPESSFQKLKDMMREERMKVGQHPSAISSDNKDFGKVVLSPPNGQDGRIANKPKELMTSFEKIRFGHADDLLGGNDEIDRRHGSGLFPVKRRNGFIGLPILNPHRMDMAKGMLEARAEESKPKPALPSLGDGFFHLGFADLEPEHLDMDDSLIPVMSEFQFDNPPLELFMEKQPFMVEEPMPSCPEVENQPCLTNDDCCCVGFGLYRCLLGQCQVLSLVSAVGEEGPGKVGEGLWHSEPVSTSHLGVWETSGGEMKKKRAVVTNPV